MSLNKTIKYYLFFICTTFSAYGLDQTITNNRNREIDKKLIEEITRENKLRVMESYSSKKRRMYMKKNKIRKLSNK